MANSPARTGQVVPEAPDSIELQSVDNATLRQQLQDAIGLTEQAILRAAVLWRELRRRGEDLSDIRFPLAKFMLPIAEGSLIPGLAIALAGQTRTLERLAALPVDRQRAIEAGEEIEIFHPERGILHKPVLSMSYPETLNAIRDGRILTAAEQRRAIETRPTRVARKSKSVDIRLDVDTYNAAATAAAEAGVSIDHYLRRIILAKLGR